MVITKDIKQVINDSAKICFLRRSDGNYWMIAEVESKYKKIENAVNVQPNILFDYPIECSSRLNRLYQSFTNRYYDDSTIMNTIVDTLKVNDDIRIRVEKQHMGNDDTLYNLYLFVDRTLKSGKTKRYTYLLHTTLEKYL